MLFLFASLGLAMAGPVQDVTSPIQTWLEAAESRDVARLDAAFFPEAIQMVRMGDKTVPLPLDAYKDMLGQGKIGGSEMTLVITSVSVDGDVASVSARRESASMVFHDAISLLRGAEGWRIVGASIQASKR